MLNEYLAALPDLGARHQGGMRAADFSLERIATLLAALGAPQQAYPGLHIAGTHGKGSVAALSAAALKAAGYRVGSFTSPHLEGALAGIRLDGEPADPGALEASFAEMLPHLVASEDWTHFEVVTALAFLHFARAAVGAAVIEAGLGGRVDATNAWTPSVSVITPVDFDHTSILGDSLAQIAAEKAGIIKPGVPLVIAPQAPEARQIILQAAAEHNAAVSEVGTDLLFDLEGFDLSGQQIRVWSPADPPGTVSLRIGMLGRHQAANAATAYAALGAQAATGLPVPGEAIRNGFAAARWPGRFELLQSDPPLLLDAAHSPGAARALRGALDDYFPGRRVVLVLGVSADKDLGGLLEPLRDLVEGAIATQSEHPRAMPAGELQAHLAQAGLAARAEADAGAALRAALGAVGPGQLVLVCGSVFLVDQARELHPAPK
ncbi:MAG: hypothetical protein KIS85_04540 [Anaerolineales bacterium]|nr:hypothetical protein [Anaerolineales bacterium]